MADLQLTSQGLRDIVAQLAAIIRDDVALRTIQGGNAPTCIAFNYGTLGAVTPVKIAEAQNNNVQFTSLVILFQDTAGRGRFRIDGPAPAASGIGFPIPAGGGTLPIFGINNIRAFQMIAETGATLDYAYGLFV